MYLPTFIAINTIVVRHFTKLQKHRPGGGVRWKVRWSPVGWGASSSGNYESLQKFILTHQIVVEIFDLEEMMEYQVKIYSANVAKNAHGWYLVSRL